MPVLRILEDSNGGPFGFGIIPGIQKWWWEITAGIRERGEEEKKRTEEEGPLGWGVIPKIKREIKK